MVIFAILNKPVLNSAMLRVWNIVNICNSFQRVFFFGIKKTWQSVGWPQNTEKENNGFAWNDVWSFPTMVNRRRKHYFFEILQPPIFSKSIWSRFDGTQRRFSFTWCFLMSDFCSIQFCGSEFSLLVQDVHMCKSCFSVQDSVILCQ